MKQIYLAIAAAALAGAALNVSADEAIKVGIVNTERILREASPAIKAQKKIEKEFAARDQELQKMAQQAKELQTLLEKEEIAMSEADRRNKERDLATLNRDFQRAQREFREDLNLRKNEETALILQRADKAIQAIAEAEKFDLILQQESIVYRSQKIDITEKIIKALAQDK